MKKFLGIVVLGLLKPRLALDKEAIFLKSAGLKL